MNRQSRGKHTSVRNPVDPTSSRSFSPFDGTPDWNGTDQSEENDEDDINDKAPKVVLGSVGDLGPERCAHLDRPIWVLLDQHESMVGLFERYPEAVMPSQVVSSLLTSIRQFAVENAADLQMLLGPGDKLRTGFHTSASLEEVVESFEDDGFDVLLGIAHGRVVLPANDIDRVSR